MLEISLSILFFIIVIWHVIQYRLRCWRDLEHKRLGVGGKNQAYIYVWRDLEDRRYLKVGQTNNVPRRMKAFQTAQPRGIKIVAVTQVRDKVYAEAYLHNKFRNLRVRGNGEWFYSTLYLRFYCWYVLSGKLTQKYQNSLLTNR